MLRVQVATGMRPSEVCNIRPCDIDRSGEVWMFRPAKHKTANKGKRKAVPLMGDARDAITDYMNRDPQAYCFSPAESMAWFRANQRANRQSKVQPSQEDRTKESPTKKPGKRYDATRATAKAFSEPPSEPKLKRGTRTSYGTWLEP